MQTSIQSSSKFPRTRPIISQSPTMKVTLTQRKTFMELEQKQKTSSDQSHSGKDIWKAIWQETP